MTMLENATAFSSFSIDDVAAARKFYSQTLGLAVSEMSEGLSIKLAGGGNIFLYPKSDHTPATFTVLNFQVDDIDQAVSDLRSRGVEFESLDGNVGTDSEGIFRGSKHGKGPDIAWFRDPAGNFLSVLKSPAS
jgi:catechol 2,3-dioxygenase-like lactoylglutathione lyase family enzyme